MIDIALFASLKGSDCIDDVCETIGKWADDKYADVCQQLDEANRIIQELKDELEGNVASKEASKQTVFQLEHENKCLELWYHKYVQLEGKYKQLNDNSVERRRYDAMLTDYIDLVSKVKDGTALEYIMGLK
ncbi:hypothetical protein UFOVP1192_32 [uncultured Caudovirales phage]|uniref:Uncharacterized protein n=1 Tax=uncultured Caudovirales phage TaxID=2100421 RepID=A0A6J5R8P1_9CAUD|nr:hypothetical protein UFOVP1192_32 [uncultured Caudovirales phage]